MGRMKKVAVDLFAGTGGFSHGWIQGGGVVAVAVDCWPEALQNHKHNHPDVQTLILELGFSIEETAKRLKEYLEPFGECHFHLHGSPPCQDLSNASMGDPEKGMKLVLWFLDLVEYMKPDSWSMENVSPLGKRLDPLNVPYQRVDSANFGVPQRRKRIFAGEGWTLEPTHAKDKWVSVIEAIPELIGKEFQAAPSMVSRWKNLTVQSQSPTITSQSQNQIRIVSRRISKKMTVVRKVDAQYYAPSSPAHTITKVVYVIENMKHKRSMTVEEAAIIQGFPDLQFMDNLKMVEKRVMVANMVCPPIAKAICEGIQ